MAPGHPLGFPGPAGHGFAYNRLKLRQIERLVREHKRGRLDRIGLLTGVRRDESQRRMRMHQEIERRGGQLWISPIIDWTNEQMRAYRAEHDLPQSDVAALIHRSGECNCGAFAAPGERDMISAMFPEWWAATIEPLEAEAFARGIPRCRWGEKYPLAADELPPPVGIICSGCEVAA